MVYRSGNPKDAGQLEKFWASVPTERDEVSCWGWLGNLTYKGYGVLPIGGRSVPAHRFSFYLHNPDMDHALVVDHICRNRSCVNPNHLRLLTNKDNVLCGIGLTAQNARKTKCKRGHALSGKNLFVNTKGERICRTCTQAAKSARYYKNRMSETQDGVYTLNSRFKDPLRAIVDCTNNGNGTDTVKLECGHTAIRMHRGQWHKRTRCHDCRIWNKAPERGPRP